MANKTKPGQWGQNQMAILLGMTPPAMSRVLNGIEYPTLWTMQKFQVVLGWPVEEQVALIPLLWEEPDLRYSMVLRQHFNDWALDNPRTVGSTEVRMHPALGENYRKRQTRGQRDYARRAQKSE